MQYLCVTEISSLKKIKEVLPEYIEYHHIKIVLAMLVKQYGQKVEPTGGIYLDNSQGAVSKQGSSQIDLTQDVSSSMRW